MIFLIGKQNILRFVLNDVYYSTILCFNPSIMIHSMER